MFTGDYFPDVDPQVLRNMRRSILSEVSATTPYSMNTPMMRSLLIETQVEALRNAYAGFDYQPSHSFTTRFGGGGASTSRSAAAKPQQTTSAGTKRARSPTTTVEEVKDDAPMPTIAASSSVTTAKTPSGGSATLPSSTAAATPATFTPTATLDPPDYQGRSYLFPPTIDPTAAGKATRVPKRMLCMTPSTANTHGVQVLRWALPHGHLVFAGDVGGTVKAWNPSSAATMRAPVATFNSHSLPITAMCVEECGHVLTTSSHDGYVRRWDAEAGTVTSSIWYKGIGCSEHVVHPENSNLILAAFDKEIALFDLRVSNSGATSASAAKKDSTPQRLYQGHMGGVMNLTFLNTSGSLFVSSSSDKTIRTWDFRVPVQVRQLGDPSMHAAPHIIRHPTRENTILAQSADNKIRIIDCDEGGRLRIVRDKFFVGHTASGTSCMLAMSRDGQFVSSGDATGQVFVWEYATQQIVRKFPAHNNKQCSSHLWHPQEPSKMVTGGWDNMIKVWV